MPRHYIHGADVDTDRLASALHRLADGIDAGDVAITATSTTHDVPDAEDLSEFGFRLRYHATHQYADVVDIIRYATRAYLRFDDRYIAPIVRGDKTLTVRYGLERTFEPGEEIALVDQDGETFAEAEIEACLDMPIRRVCDFGIGDYTEVDVDDLVDTLRDHYDDTYIDVKSEITPDSYVTVLLFGHADPVDDYPTERYT